MISKATVKKIGLGACPDVVGAIGLSDILQQRTYVPGKVLKRNRFGIWLISLYFIQGTASSSHTTPQCKAI